MKKFVFAIVLLLSAVDAFACLGGRAELFNGQIVLTAESVKDENGDSIGTEEMSNRGIPLTYVENGELITVKAEYVKSDAGGIIYTVYSVNKSNSTSYIKVESNYHGNGVMSRGLDIEPEFEISETFGC